MRLVSRTGLWLLVAVLLTAWHPDTYPAVRPEPPRETQRVSGLYRWPGVYVPHHIEAGEDDGS